MPHVVAEYIDRLCTVEMRPGNGNMPRGIIHQLYEPARRSIGEPLTLNMARGLLDALGEGDSFLVITGAGGPPALPYGEVDGLLGAAALARALYLARGATPVFVAEERVTQPLIAAARAAGLNINNAGSADAIGHDGHAAIFVPAEIDTEQSRQQAITLLDQYTPKAVIAIEKLAPNERGIIHGTTGLPYNDVHMKPQFLFAEAATRGIITAGIGDGGNEVGFGRIADTVTRVMPNGRLCQCPCGGGLASSVTTDLFVVAAISNWGGYGVAAMIAFLEKRLDALIDEDDLTRMLTATVDAGAVDGVYARPTLSDDGVPLAAQRALLTMLRTCIGIAASNVRSPGH
jgi:hypothetical protein